jgi:hypothetical protein
MIQRQRMSGNTSIECEQRDDADSHFQHRSGGRWTAGHFDRDIPTRRSPRRIAPVMFEYSVGVDEIEDEETHRPRQFGFEPSSLCMWGAKSGRAR